MSRWCSDSLESHNSNCADKNFEMTKMRDHNNYNLGEGDTEDTELDLVEEREK